MTSIELSSPSSWQMFLSLFKADLVVQWRNRRAGILSMIAPVAILIAWHKLVTEMGGPFVIASCITIGLGSVGLMGFANTIAVNREKGIFQRLRVTPASTLQIMSSRVSVQLVQIALMDVVLFIVAFFVDNVTLSIIGYIAALTVSLFCGAVYLALGLAFVGLIPRTETLNAVTRFVYIALVVVGAIGELGVLGDFVKQIVLWSPYGTVKVVLLASMMPSTWNITATEAFAVSVLYTIVFAFIGIKWFRWSSQ